MLVFSPWIGTSDVLPGSIGSGGAVISCASLYSGFDCDGSVLTDYRVVIISFCEEKKVVLLCLFQDWHSVRRAAYVSIGMY
jgi:hypothetical protein